MPPRYSTTGLISRAATRKAANSLRESMKNQSNRSTNAPTAASASRGRSAASR
jgi:hypothetical protein